MVVGCIQTIYRQTATCEVFDRVLRNYMTVQILREHIIGQILAHERILQNNLWRVMQEYGIDRLMLIAIK